MEFDPLESFLEIFRIDDVMNRFRMMFFFLEECEQRSEILVFFLHKKEDDDENDDDDYAQEYDDGPHFGLLSDKHGYTTYLMQSIKTIRLI